MYFKAEMAHIFFIPKKGGAEKLRFNEYNTYLYFIIIYVIKLNTCVYVCVSVWLSHCRSEVNKLGENQRGKWL